LIGTEGDTTEADKTPLIVRCPYMEITRCFDMLPTLSDPRVIKTHLTVEMVPQKVWEKRIKLVHVLRHPKDVAVSLYHFYRSNKNLGQFKGSWEEVLNMYITGNVVHGAWFPYVKDWYKFCHDKEHVLFVTYEQLLQQPFKSIKNISEFLGKNLPDEIIQKIVDRTSFKSMKANKNTNFSLVSEVIDPKISPFMRKGEIGDWKNYFTVAQNEIFDKLFAQEMKDFMDFSKFYAK